MIYLIPFFMALVAYVSSKDRAFKSLTTGFVAGVLFLFFFGEKLLFGDLFVLGTIIGLYATDLVKLLKLVPNLYLEETVHVNSHN